MTKIDRIRIQTTLSQDTKTIAACISLLSALCNPERVLRTIAYHFGFRLERV